MLVDDSVVVRGLMDRWLSQDPAISVVGSASNGAIALRELERCHPEVVVLDLEMPVMGGMEALPKLLKLAPHLKVIVASTLSLRNAEISLEALAAGAADYLPKPESTRDKTVAANYQRDLIEKIKALGEAARGHAQRLPGSKAAPAAGAAPAAPKALYADKKVVLRKAAAVMPRLLAIGSSTGGPQALFNLFGVLKNKVKLPILITQHMPPKFTTILAAHLQKVSGVTCAEAVEGEEIKAGRIYIAPGDWHMTVVEDGDKKVIHLDQNPPENFCRPAVDPLFRSIAKCYGSAALAVVLTGMGADGMRGGQVLVDAGGSILAQDEPSSVVWGMPGAVATAGLCCGIFPLDQMGSKILRSVGAPA
jgi:two-component system, chemotaxis family, protein-glutamate methylesterase/glutaminase